MIKNWYMFDTWECYTCQTVIDRMEGETYSDWMERIYQHWNNHPNPVKLLPNYLNPVMRKSSVKHSKFKKKRRKRR